jgi:phage/plasmid primase-like uncharacterized protein
VGILWKQEGGVKNQSLKEALAGRQEAARTLQNHSLVPHIIRLMDPHLPSRIGTHAGTLRKTPQKDGFLSAESVLAQGRGRTQALAQSLLGEHNIHRSSNSCLRYGASGKLAVHIHGPQEGLWYDFGTGEGGNILRLIQREKGLSFKEAVQYCGDFWGVCRENNTQTSRHTLQAQTRTQTQEKPERLQSAVELFQKSRPVYGTVAEVYLRQERGIQGELSPDIRFLPRGTRFTYGGTSKVLKQDCCVAFGRSAGGNLSVAQITKLAPKGTRALDPDGNKLPKIQYGVSKGAFVTVQKAHASEKVWIAEGVETALSIKEAGITGTILASLGIHNLKNYQGPEPQVILCGDHDGPQSRTHGLMAETITHLETRGKSVHHVQPKDVGQDFNDVLKEGGVGAVQASLEKVLKTMDTRDDHPQISPKREETLSRELDEKLQKLIQNPGDRELKKDLLSWAKTLHHDSELQAKIHGLNPQMTQDMERLRRQQRRDMSMEK